MEKKTGNSKFELLPQTRCGAKTRCGMPCKNGRMPNGRCRMHGGCSIIFRVKDDKEAVKLASDSPYGLGGSVITEDIARGKRVAGQIDTGMVFINQATWTAPDLPFGGVKNSGYGRELSDLVSVSS